MILSRQKVLALALTIVLISKEDGNTTGSVHRCDSSVYQTIGALAWVPKYTAWSLIHLQAEDSLASPAHHDSSKTKQPVRTTFEYIPLQEESNINSGLFRRYLKTSLLGLTLISNWGAFYLKRKADDHYRLYQQESDIRKIRYYYHQVQKLDTWSNILVGLSISSLGIYLYLWIRD